MNGATRLAHGTRHAALGKQPYPLDALATQNHGSIAVRRLGDGLRHLELSAQNHLRPCARLPCDVKQGAARLAHLKGDSIGGPGDAHAQILD
ncbi:hypothetical protein D3C80_1379270 [compost metagenome]